MPKIAIVCDDYKQEKFEEELKKADIIYSIQPFTKGTINFVCISEQHIIKPIVNRVTQFFIDKYKTEN